MMQANFLDQEYLKKLVDAQAEKVNASSSPVELVLMYSGARLNWIADFFTDSTVTWSKQKIKIDDIVFTGTNPVWNKILIDKCERSPKKFRELLSRDESIATIFSDVTFSDVPILVRKEEDKLKILDGTHRLVAAIIQGMQDINAYIAEGSIPPRPACEPHVVYDLIRAYQRGLNRDREGLVAALKFLRRAYSNVDELLRNRFNLKWLPDEEIQKIIAEVLKK